MLHIVFQNLNEFLDEMLILRNKRIARNIKEPMVYRYSIQLVPEGDGNLTAYWMFQTFAEIDHIQMIYELITEKTEPFPKADKETKVASLQAEMDEAKAKLEKEIDKADTIMPGYYTG